MNILSALIVLCFAFFSCHASYVGDKYNGMPEPETFPGSLDPDLKAASHEELKRAVTSNEEESNDQYVEMDSDSEEFDHPVAVHQRVKRTSEPIYFTPAYCKTLGYCGLMLNLSAVCLAKCNFDRVELLRPYIGLIPELPSYMCQTVNTIFPSLPKLLRTQGTKVVTVRGYLKTILNVKPEDEADVAKTSANALPVTLIKNVASPNLDEFKPVIKKLEIHDADKRKPNQILFAGKLLNSLLSLSTGQFVNPKCDKTNLDDEAMMMIAAMKLRKCNMDLLMPGYFVFNVAPRVASTREVSPLLKALNMPLIMFLGVKCCMTQFAIQKTRTKCMLGTDLLSKPHGLPSNNGPDTVCNAIPSFWPITPPPPTTPPTITIGPVDETDTDNDTEDAATEGIEEATTESICNDDNKSELEECATISGTAEYSEEATEASAEGTTGSNTEIESDENDY